MNVSISLVGSPKIYAEDATIYEQIRPNLYLIGSTI
jgi:hypothetical protein